MANKRMFSKEIVGSDAFQDMPSSSQLLYFHLGMEADDDGFIGNPKKISRSIGMADDDMKILVAKRFVLLFDSGVLVIKHHRINNNWDKYNCKRTMYVEEFNQLYIKPNKAYTQDKTQGIPIQSENSLKTVFRIEENRIEENRRDNNASVVSSLTGIPLGKDYTPDHHSPLEKKKALPKAPKSEKQVTAIQALKLIDYFKEQMYEIHGDDMPYLKGSAREDPKMVRLFKQGIESLGEEAPAYVDWWLMEGGEYFKFDPRVCFAKSQVEKYKAGKVMKRKSDKPLSL